MSDRIDLWLIHHIGMTHPPIWAMWLSIFMSYAALFGVLRRKNK